MFAQSSGKKLNKRERTEPTRQVKVLLWEAFFLGKGIEHLVGKRITIRRQQ